MGGGSETIGRSKRARSTPDIVDPAKTPAPGKATGIPLVDNVRDMTNPENFLDDVRRGRAELALSTVAQSGASNAHAAIARHRDRLLTTIQTPSAWNGFTEFWFQAGSGLLVGLLEKAAIKLKARATETIFTEGATLEVGGIDVTEYAPQIAQLNVGMVKGIAVQGSKGVRTTAKNAAHAAPVASEENVDKADHLSKIENDIGANVNDLVLVRAGSLTDVQLIALVAAYADQSAHSVDAYYDAIADYLDRYDAQRIGKIGVNLDPDGKRGSGWISRIEAVWVSCGTKVRLALVEVYNPIHAKTQPVKGYNGKVVPWEQAQFVSWPDDGLSREARERTADVTGKKTLDLINATNADTGIPEIDAWATEAAR